MQGVLGMSCPGNEFITVYTLKQGVWGSQVLLVLSSCPTGQLWFLTGLGKSCSDLPHRGTLTLTDLGKAFHGNRCWRTVRMQRTVRMDVKQKAETAELSFQWEPGFTLKRKTRLTGRILKQGGNNQLNSHTFSFEDFKALTHLLSHSPRRWNAHFTD